MSASDANALSLAPPRSRSAHSHPTAAESAGPPAAPAQQLSLILLGGHHALAVALQPHLVLQRRRRQRPKFLRRRSFRSGTIDDDDGGSSSGGALSSENHLAASTRIALVALHGGEFPRLCFLELIDRLSQVVQVIGYQDLCWQIARFEIAKIAKIPKITKIAAKSQGAHPKQMGCRDE